MSRSETLRIHLSFLGERISDTCSYEWVSLQKMLRYQKRDPEEGHLAAS